MATGGNSSEATTIDARAGAARAAEPTRLDGVRARPCAPRTVTTGGKNDQGDQQSADALIGIDLDTGEPVAFEVSANRVVATRRLAPNTAIVAPVAQTDALAFSVVPPDDLSMRWVVEQMKRFLPIDDIEERRGCFGFKQSIRFGDGAGIVAWGGKSQRGRVYFSIQGKGCALVIDWAAVARWLEDNRATIKRVDVAYDDFTGATVSVAWAIEQYRAGGFTFGGRKPEHVCHGDWLAGERSVKGRTLQIGKRANGKLCRIYEKGKQLGDLASPWARLEVEWRAKDRVIPFDVLLRPGAYLAGAYPCLSGLSIEQCRIKTIANASTIEFESAMAHGKQQSGKLVNLMLQVFGGDIAEVVDRLRRDGIPTRIDAYSYHLAEAPELLDPSAPGSFATILNTK